MFLEINSKHEAEMLERCTRLNCNKYYALLKSVTDEQDPSIRAYAVEGYNTAQKMHEKAVKIKEQLFNKSQNV